MATVRVEYYGVEGTGKNVTEAKRDAGEKIKRALDGTYKPTMLQSRGWVVIMWRDPDGWHSNTIMQGGELRDNAFQSYSSGSTDYYDEYKSALLHLAQMTWDGTELIPPCLAELPAMMTRRDNDGRRLLSEFTSWRGFQLAYRHAKSTMPDAGDMAWHRWACENSTRFAA